MPFLPLLIFITASLVLPFPVTFTVTPDSDRVFISPFIYGTNQALSGTENWAAYRQGGNRLSGYNWENNASSAGTDWNNSSDNFLTWNMGISGAAENNPGIVITAFHDSNQAKQAYSLITLQMAGYAAKDKNGTVQAADAAPSARWVVVKNIKGSALSLAPNLADNDIYIDEMTHFLVNRYGGAASANGIKGYALDNEPALWPSTHPLIHSAPPTCAGLISKSVGLAAAIKGQDPAAETFGPVAYGFGEYVNLQSASDWNTVKGSFDWFIAWYLDRMKRASDSAGLRLLNVLDVHWYSEARGNNERIVQAAAPANRANAIARMQAPRTLWDSSYAEDSWIGQYFSPVALIPHMQASIDRWYPGTRMAFTEYNYGGEAHVSGGIAMADVLGIFGKHGVYFASFWQMEAFSSYVTAAVKLYRNYDNSKSAFGDIRARALTTDDSLTSVYVSAVQSDESKLHIIALNKHPDSTARASFVIAGNRAYTSGPVFGFGPASATVGPMTGIANIVNNSFTYGIPAMTAVHIILTSGPMGGESASAGASAATFLTVQPQPFRAGGQFAFSIRSGKTGRLVLYDVRGKVVQVFEGLQGQGAVRWDGNSLSGAVPAGVYFAQLRAGAFMRLEKIVLMR